MIRRIAFFLLTLILAGVVIYLIVGSRREAEAPQPAQVVEVTQEAKPSLTRILKPADLKVSSSGQPASTGPQGCTALFQNTGSVPYCNLLLRVSYHDRQGKPLQTQDFMIQGAILPGGALESGGILAENAPAGTAACEIAVLSADIGTEIPAADPSEK